jgi:hypothetical protein
VCLSIQKSQQIVNHKSRPGDTLKEPDHAFAEVGRPADVVDPGADHPDAVDGVGRTALDIDVRFVHHCIGRLNFRGHGFSLFGLIALEVTGSGWSVPD